MRACQKVNTQNALMMVMDSPHGHAVVASSTAKSRSFSAGSVSHPPRSQSPPDLYLCRMRWSTSVMPLMRSVRRLKSSGFSNQPSSPYVNMRSFMSSLRVAETAKIGMRPFSCRDCRCPWFSRGPSLSISRTRSVAWNPLRMGILCASQLS
jgi:hypothetical protein